MHPLNRVLSLLGLQLSKIDKHVKQIGDDFDLDADMKTFNEMIRALKPGGCLIFSTAITRAEPSIAFNARRNYNYAMIRKFCRDLECIE